MAEDPDNGFRPSTGKIVALEKPQDDRVRAETAIAPGVNLASESDSTLVDIVVHASSRKEAFDRLAAALDQTLIVGPRSTIGFLAALVDAPAVRGGHYDVEFIAGNLAALISGSWGPGPAVMAAGAARLLARERARIAGQYVIDAHAVASPWDASDGFQLTGPRTHRFAVSAEGTTACAIVTYGPDGVSVHVDGVPAAAHVRTIDGEDGVVYVVDRGRQTTVRLSETS
jgi:3-methylcrotonyl-CoA carboxylase alpha subunit